MTKYEQKDCIIELLDQFLHDFEHKIVKNRIPEGWNSEELRLYAAFWCYTQATATAMSPDRQFMFDQSLESGDLL